MLRVVLLQIGCAAFGATVFGLLAGWAAGGAALLGGLIVAFGTGLFGWRLFAPGIAPVSVLHRALYAAETLKWLWTVLAVWASLARLKAPPLPLMTGLVFTQFGYWIGMVGTKRLQE